MFIVLIIYLISLTFKTIEAEFRYLSKSGLLPWIDIHTPSTELKKMNSRGIEYSLVMSDEFNDLGRNFSPGNDHLWVAMEKPDGVNGALEYYSRNMVTTEKMKVENKTIGYLNIQAKIDNITFKSTNYYKHPISEETKTMYYRSGMIQSWNKFCFQGGIMIVRAQLPASHINNPDFSSPNKNKRLSSMEYYPTWPGIWLMGNLGRAIFSSSTNRMWPWSFNKCDPKLNLSQRISACNGNPGSGLLPFQGRGAPEIDILEGGGVAISASIQVAPGMPLKYRAVLPDPRKDNQNSGCFYSRNCKTEGANVPGVPTNYWKRKGYKAWYQGLIYMSNNLCSPESSELQVPKNILSKLFPFNNDTLYVADNTCTNSNCPGSFDINSNISLINGTNSYYGFNSNGTCFPITNSYRGGYLCDPDNSNPECPEPYKGNKPNLNTKFGTFNYQMDALSVNYGITSQAYLDFLEYKIEWITTSSGYIRWELNNQLIYEIPASSLDNVPQDGSIPPDNPSKLMIEEPMYIIFNVALSASWGAVPPNPGKPCNFKGQNNICAGFPMHMKIDYIRLWQNENQTVGCDPSTHPTAQFITDNLEDYVDIENTYIPTEGLANCKINEDCSISAKGIYSGTCVNYRCQCYSTTLYGGPRCTTKASFNSFGPKLLNSITLTFISLLATAAMALHSNLFSPFHELKNK